MYSTETLWEWYLKGFDDELNGTSSTSSNFMIYNLAYSMGATDAFAGDDVSSVDEKSKSEIIEDIKRIAKEKNML